MWKKMWSKQDMTGKLVAVYLLAPLCAGIISSLIDTYFVKNFWLRALVFAIIYFLIFTLGLYLNETHKEKTHHNDN